MSIVPDHNKCHIEKINDNFVIFLCLKRFSSFHRNGKNKRKAKNYKKGKKCSKNSY